MPDAAVLDAPSAPDVAPFGGARTLVVVATLVGFVARLGWVMWVGERVPSSIFVDPARYLGYADNLARGNGYVENLTGQPTAYYPPGYPFFLGGLKVVHDALPLGGSFPFFVAVVQVFVGTALVPVGAYVAYRVGGRTAAVVAAVGLALYPNLVFHTAVVLSETLYNTLFMLFLALAVRRPWPAGITPRAAAVVAVPLALAIMVRPISVVVAPILVLCWWVSARDLRRVLRGALAVAAVLAAVMVPWAIRNAVVMDAFVPLSTNTGDNLCMGHHDNANGGFAPCGGTEGVQHGTASEVRNDDEKTERAVRWIVDHPGREPRLLWLRFRVMFVDHGDHDALAAIQSYPQPALGNLPWMAPDTERRLSRLADAAYVVVAVIGLAGAAVLLWRRTGPGLLVVLSGLGTALVPLAFFGDARFKVPVMPLLIVAAGVAVAVAAAVGGRWSGDDAGGAEAEGAEADTGSAD